MSSWNSKVSDVEVENSHINVGSEPFVGNVNGIAGDSGSKEQRDWEKKMLYDLAYATHKEQKSKRRWGIFFKFLIVIYIALISYLSFYPLDGTLESSSKEHTALINIEGVIASDTDASADKVVSSLRDAFKDKKTKGVILRLNTPGGSPVQSGYINDEIYRLKKEYPDIKVYAVISDVCASGGYYIAAAADEIYADKASIVGSIGVIMNGFGFVDAMKTLGISRRLYTAGEHKGFLDPFKPENSKEVGHIKSMLGNIHEQFIDVVKKGRGDKLSNDPNLFSGYFWTGEKSVELGLVDELGSSSYVAREVIKAETIKEFSYEDDLLERFSKKLGASISSILDDNLSVQKALTESVILK